jgi:cytochrome c oxidase assembly factor CtaG
VRAVVGASPYAWQADVDTTVVIPALSLLYLFAFGRFGAPRWRVACFAVAMALLAAAFWTPLHHLGLHYLLLAHLLQNVILAEWAPLFAVLGISSGMATALARHTTWRAAVHPAIALPLWLLNYFAWHVPAVYVAALERQGWLIHVEHACYFATGILMWWPLLQDVPRRLPSGARAAYAFAAFLLASPLGLLLALVPKPVYDFYVDARPRVWGLSALADQQIAGVTMASEQAIVLFVVFLYWFRRFLAEEGAT